MKKELSKRKLTLKKKTISVLSAGMQRGIHGGATLSCDPCLTRDDCYTLACDSAEYCETVIDTCGQTGISVGGVNCNGGTLPKTR